MNENPSAIHRWVTVAPGVDLKIELDKHVVASIRELHDDGEGTTEVMGKIVGVSMTLAAIDSSIGWTADEEV